MLVTVRQAAIIILLNLWAIGAFAQCPSVRITSSKSAYCISDYIQLEAIGVLAGSSVAWDLGNGWDTTGTDHFGSTPTFGMLTPKLEVTLSNGTVCSYEETDLVEIYDLPTPQFGVSRNLLCSGIDTIKLYDLTNNTFRRNWVIELIVFIQSNYFM